MYVDKIVCLTSPQQVGTSWVVGCKMLSDVDIFLAAAVNILTLDKYIDKYIVIVSLETRHSLRDGFNED